ncbi:MAG: hypothetical protein ACRC8M_10455 [Cetobacterium sp.]|uniref:hypothetical protein n=1 Tax=Cetobacterium sp. TaxID=2071632 RepID=UPI003F2E936E
MKKLLAMLALSLAMVACGEKQDTTPNDPNPPVQTTDLAQPTDSQTADNANRPVEAIEETIEEQITPVTPAEIKAAENAATKPGVEAVEETIEEQVQEVVPPATDTPQAPIKTPETKPAP